MAHLFLELGIRRIVVDLRKPIYSVFTKTMQIRPTSPVSRESCTSVSFLLSEEFQRRRSVLIFRETPSLLVQSITMKFGEKNWY